MNTDIKNVRKYNSVYRKKLKCRIEYIKDKHILVEIYNIVISDIGNNFSTNNNGIFINLNILSDKCISKLECFIKNNNNINRDNILNISNIKLDYEDVNTLYDFGHKFSNQEKSVLKKKNQI